MLREMWLVMLVWLGDLVILRRLTEKWNNGRIKNKEVPPIDG